MLTLALALAVAVHGASALPMASLTPRDAFDLSSFGQDSSHLSKNKVFLGLYPNGDEDGIKPLNEAADTKFLIWGTTIQADSGKPVDVRGLAKSWLAMKDANAVPVIDVMPVGGWKGFTDDDDTQAWTIAMHCKLTKMNTGAKTVWLRFGIDMNYYQSDDGGHKYAGSADDFKKAWKVMAKALQDNSPDTKLIWTPAASKKPEDATVWYPTDQKVDAIGFSYHATDASDDTYKQRLLDFYNCYGKDMKNADVPVIMGPLSFSPKDDASAEEKAKQKIDFLNKVTSADIGLPNYIAAIYDNEKTKDGDARIVYSEPETKDNPAAVKTNEQIKDWAKPAA